MERPQHVDEVYDARPPIEGFTPEESAAIYDGTYDSILDEIRAIPDVVERNKMINARLGMLAIEMTKLGSQAARARDEEKDMQRADTFMRSRDRLEAFHSRLRAMHSDAARP
jgi:hypothetical protein